MAQKVPRPEDRRVAVVGDDDAVECLELAKGPRPSATIEARRDRVDDWLAQQRKDWKPPQDREIDVLFPHRVHAPEHVALTQVVTEGEQAALRRAARTRRVDQSQHQMRR